MTRDDGFGPTASGAWRGFYLYTHQGERHAMQLDLVFGTSTVSGSGSDDIGAFQIRGGFEPEGVRVWWSKQYVGAHAVWYAGVRDGTQPRVMYGSWSLGAADAGGFKIWRGAHDGAELADVASDRVALAREVLRR